MTLHAAVCRQVEVKFNQMDVACHISAPELIGFDSTQCVRFHRVPSLLHHCSGDLEPSAADMQGFWVFFRKQFSTEQVVRDRKSGRDTK